MLTRNDVGMFDKRLTLVQIQGLKDALCAKVL
jgi:hypothetical protein